MSKKFLACAPPHCKCPEIELVGDHVIIHDDFNGEVLMKCSEFEMIIDWYQSRGGDKFDPIIPTAREVK